MKELARKPISIISHCTPKGAYYVLIALCDDGSIWRLFADEWERIPEVPQPEPKGKKQ